MESVGNTWQYLQSRRGSWLRSPTVGVSALCTAHCLTINKARFMPSKRNYSSWFNLAWWRTLDLKWHALTISLQVYTAVSEDSRLNSSLNSSPHHTSSISRFSACLHMDAVAFWMLTSRFAYWHDTTGTHVVLPGSRKAAQDRRVQPSSASPRGPKLHPNCLLHWRALPAWCSDWESPSRHQSPAPCHSCAETPQWLSSLRRQDLAEPDQGCERTLAEALERLKTISTENIKLMTDSSAHTHIQTWAGQPTKSGQWQRKEKQKYFSILLESIRAVH